MIAISCMKNAQNIDEQFTDQNENQPTEMVLQTTGARNPN